MAGQGDLSDVGLGGWPLLRDSLENFRSGPVDTGHLAAHVEGRPEGARSADGRVEGSYLHGLFAEDAFRAAWLAGLGAVAGGVAYGAAVEAVLDRLAAHLETHLDVDGLLAAAR